MAFKYIKDEKCYNHTYYLRHKERYLHTNRSRRQLFKKLFFELYGNICWCCGENNRKFLSLNHLLIDGAEHRRQTQNNNSTIYRNAVYSIADGELKYSILCFNCNTASYIHGVCPHVK